MNDETSRLLNANNYRDFLKISLEKRADRKKTSFAAFSRRSGFSSRSFPRDVVAGSRRITATSLPKFTQGLRLKGDWRIYFELLVAREEPRAVPHLVRSLDSRKLEIKLDRVRKRLLRKPVSEKKASQLFKKNQRWIEVYSSLGRPGEGERFENICQKSGIDSSICQSILNEMVDLGVVNQSHSTGNYAPTDIQLSMPGMGQSESAKLFYKQTLDEVSVWSQNYYSSDEHLFLTSVFSLEKSRLTEFKKHLRELIERFVDQAENPDGDSIGKLLVAFGKKA